MKIHSIIAIIVSLLVISSCGPKLDEENKVLYDKVMEIHDDVMPKMSDIHKAKKALNKLKTDENTSAVEAMVTRLDNADEAMMSWMHSFDVPEGSADVAKAYLTKEMDKISAVRTDMLSAIDAAHDLKTQIEQ